MECGFEPRPVRPIHHNRCCECWRPIKGSLDIHLVETVDGDLRWLDSGCFREVLQNPELAWRGLRMLPIDLERYRKIIGMGKNCS